MSESYVPASAGGESCKLCGKPAARKVEEYIFDDDPQPHRHPLTAYLCRAHFDQIMRWPEPTLPTRQQVISRAERALAEASPGPWAAVPNSDGVQLPFGRWTVVQSSGREVCIAVENERDARFIQAARALVPEMLTLLTGEE